jgi:hypothetical protein
LFVNNPLLTPPPAAAARLHIARLGRRRRLAPLAQRQNGQDDERQAEADAKAHGEADSQAMVLSSEEKSECE